MHTSALLLGGIYLVERRGKKERVHAQRQVDLSTVLESIPEAALVIDGERVIVDANNAAADLLGYSREQLVGAKWERANKAISESGNGQTPGPVVERVLHGEVIRAERSLVRSGRRNELELLISATPMRNERGDVVAALVIARDVTELTRLQRRIGDVERHLAIGQMAAALAHDFNNILTAIGQAAYLLENNEQLSDEDRRSYLGVIQNAVQRGSEVISSVREYLRTGSGARQPVDVRRLLREAVELTRPLADNAKVRVRTELRSVPEAIGNAADLRRVFTNVVINAIEAMPQGGQMTVGCFRDNHDVVVTVTDTGGGIAPEDRGKIFFPYFTTKQKGTGLGLSGAQKMLLAQGGNISFRTELGKGTTFVITLPVAQRNPQQRSAEQCRHKPAA